MMILCEEIATPANKFAMIQITHISAPPEVICVCVASNGLMQTFQLDELKLLRWTAPNRGLFVDLADLP